MSTGGGALGARSAEGAASVCTGGNAVNARSAEEAASASTGGSAVGARTAKVCLDIECSIRSTITLFVAGETPPGWDH